jgi:hypothetical protein
MSRNSFPPFPALHHYVIILFTLYLIICYNTLTMELTKDLAYSGLQQILRDKVLLVIGTGASMALDRRYKLKILKSVG